MFVREYPRRADTPCAREKSLSLVWFLIFASLAEPVRGFVAGGGRREKVFGRQGGAILPSGLCAGGQREVGFVRRRGPTLIQAVSTCDSENIVKSGHLRSRR